MIRLPNPIPMIAPGLLALPLLVPSTRADARPMPAVALATPAGWNDDDLEDYYEDLAERRREYLEDLAERREEYFEDLDDHHRRLRRHHAFRPPFAPPSPYIVPGPVYGGGAFGHGPDRPYPFRAGLPYGYGLPYGGPGYGFGPYGGVAPYGGGYGFGPGGGIDIPFGFGLGGLSIRW